MEEGGHKVVTEVLYNIRNSIKRTLFLICVGVFILFDYLLIY